MSEIRVATRPTGRHNQPMRAFIVAILVFAVASPAAAHEAVPTVWWAAGDFWKSTAPFFGAFLGFFGATFVNDWLQQRRERENRREAALVLATALMGEALAAADTHDRTRKHLLEIAEDWKDGPPDHYEETDMITSEGMPAITAHIYKANVTSIGLLADPALISDIVQYFSETTSEDFSVYRDGYRKICIAWADTNKEIHDRVMRMANKLQICADGFKRVGPSH